MPAIKLAWSEANSAYVALDLGLGTYDPGRRRQGRRTGRDRRGRADLASWSAAAAPAGVPSCSKEGKSATEGVTGSDGTIDFLHLAPGTCRVAEVEGARRIRRTPEMKTFTVAADGRSMAGTPAKRASRTTTPRSASPSATSPTSPRSRAPSSPSPIPGARPSTHGPRPPKITRSMPLAPGRPRSPNSARRPPTTRPRASSSR